MNICNINKTKVLSFLSSLKFKENEVPSDENPEFSFNIGGASYTVTTFTIQYDGETDKWTKVMDAFKTKYKLE